MKKGNQYTVPRIRYNYERVSWETYMQNKYDGYLTVRSAFIPYVIIDNERYWLLGSFHDYPGDILMDFGGNCIVWDPPRSQLKRNQRQKRNYQHQFGCAVLELNEESKGLLVKPVLSSLGNPYNQDNILIYRGTSHHKKEHVWFVMVPINYEEAMNVIQIFPTIKLLNYEKLGPLGIYRERDILAKYHRTSRNLTDFVDFFSE